ncbi:POC1 centriolar protein homolog B-like, partial [Dendrobium catenatum]|uniref:POC1 centriolar protein homolog B-like n=1 Tax=Dendrobium catenatum TaxID=906689 RepID=UPI00109FD658
SFDIEPSGRHLGTGGQDGIVQIYDLQSGEWVSGFQAASDTVNCFSFHPSVPLAASSSGNRRFIMPGNVEDSYSLRGILTPNIFVIHACFYFLFILLLFLTYT